MKRNYFCSLVALFLFSSLLVSAQGSRQERDHQGFSRVAFGIAGNLNVEFARDYSIVLEGDPGTLREIVTEVRDNRLIIRYENSFRAFRNMQQVNVRITMPEMSGLSVSGSGKAEISEPVSADNLALSVSGSGKLLAGEVEADELVCSISGSGDLIINGSGSVDRGKITISGSGSYSGEQMEIDHLTVSVSGSGSCYCKAGDSLNASVSGSGNVIYSGDPTIDSRVSGSGRVRSK